MPCDYRDYHPEWKWIRRQILSQADNRCEFCGVNNHTPLSSGWKVVLTIAHLDHDTGNNDPANLKALCQKCHLSWDLDHHKRRSAATRRRKLAETGQTALPIEAHLQG